MARYGFSKRKQDFRMLAALAIIGGVLSIFVASFGVMTTDANPEDTTVIAAAQPQPTYHQFGGLAYESVDVDSEWTKLKTSSEEHSFTKNSNDSIIEVFVNSRFYVQVFDANGIRIEVRIDDTIVPEYGNQGSILSGNPIEFESIFAVFDDLPAGTHTVSLWARAFGGSVTGVSADVGNWGGRIIVKETL